MGDIVESILLEAECRRLGFQITKSHFNLSAWLRSGESRIVEYDQDRMRAIAGSILTTTSARGATAAMNPKNGANQPLDMSSETRIFRKCILKIITYEGSFQFNDRKLPRR